MRTRNVFQPCAFQQITFSSLQKNIDKRVSNKYDRAEISTHNPHVKYFLIQEICIKNNVIAYEYKLYNINRLPT